MESSMCNENGLQAPGSRLQARIGLLVAVGLFVARPAAAQTVDATATSLISGRQDPRDGAVHTVVPFYESLSILASDLKNPMVQDTKVVLSAWGSLVAADQPTGNDATGDVDLAYVEGTVAHKRLTLRAGRQLVFGGAARALPLDGLDVRTKIGGGVGVDVYGGVPATPKFALSQGDAAAGGRVFWRPSPTIETGASFVHVLGDGRIDRQEAGVDARFSPRPSLAITALALWSTVEERLAEAQLQAIWQPWRMMELSLDAARQSPDLLLPRGSIFSVFAEETRDELGGGLYLRPLKVLRVYLDGHAISDESGVGARAGGRMTLSAAGATFGAETRAMELPQKGFVELRGFATRRLFEKAFATLDAEAVWLDPAVNGQTNSLTFSAALGWDVAPGWMAVASGLAGETPLLERRYELMGKLVYNGTLRRVETAPVNVAQAGVR
jgi:hypothetical protein